MRRQALPFLLTALLVLSSGCASKKDSTMDASLSAPSPAATAQINPAPAPAAAEIDLDDYDSFDEEDAALSHDPLEGWNRFWFDVNDWCLKNVLKPAHKAYAFIVPEPVRGAVSNFRHNLAFPVRMLNYLLQGEFAQAGIEFSKGIGNFMVTLGFGDVTSRNEPLFPYYPEAACFDHTLSVWGVPDGPYFVIPFMGPSTIRGAFGEAGDAAMKPQNYMFDEWYVTLGVDLYLRFNDFDKQYKAYDQITESALEPYVAVRNAYLSQRKSRQERLNASEH